VRLWRFNQGLNRIGNMLVPNENYCKFEEWLMPLLDKMLDEQVLFSFSRYAPPHSLSLCLVT